MERVSGDIEEEERLYSGAAWYVTNWPLKHKCLTDAYYP